MQKLKNSSRLIKVMNKKKRTFEKKSQDCVESGYRFWEISIYLYYIPLNLLMLFDITIWILIEFKINSMKFFINLIYFYKYLIPQSVALTSMEQCLVQDMKTYVNLKISLCPTIFWAFLFCLSKIAKFWISLYIIRKRRWGF